MIGDKAIVIELLTCFGVDDRHVNPIDRQGIGTTAQAHVVEVAHQRHFRKAPVPVAVCTLGHREGWLL